MTDSNHRGNEDTLRGVKRLLWILLIVALVLAIWGVVSRVRGREKTGKETSQEAIPVVMTAKPTPSPGTDELVLPGNVTAFIEAPIYARTSGYLKTWYTDIGALINAGQAMGSQLFRVSDVTRLRVYVQVPEQYAPQTKPGVEAQLHFFEHPGAEYPAQVVRTAQALDPTLRTLQVELQVDNAKGELFPGAYAEVHFKLPGRTNTLRVPATALVFRAAGLQVATVGQDSHVKLLSVSQGRDFGTTVELVSGVSLNDVIIVNPPDSITDGAQVRIAKPPPPNQQKSGKK